MRVTAIMIDMRTRRRTGYIIDTFPTVRLIFFSLIFIIFYYIDRVPDERRYHGRECPSTADERQRGVPPVSNSTIYDLSFHSSSPVSDFIDIPLMTKNYGFPCPRIDKYLSLAKRFRSHMV